MDMNKLYKPFDIALEKGHVGENRIINLLRAEGFEIGKTLIRNNAADFECRWNGRQYLVEVKNEDNYAWSKNICIEMYQGKRPKPSGVLVSKATVCIHTFADIIALYPRIEMVALVSEWEKQGVKLDEFGDNLNKGYVRPRCFFETQTRWYFESDEEGIAYTRVWERCS
jgi:hypothetical protein